MLANYGYADGSGEYFITINTELCSGCRQCAEVCPMRVIVMAQDENDPFRDDPVAVVSDEMRNQIKYACAQCKPTSGRDDLPCMMACEMHAIEHSW